MATTTGDHLSRDIPTVITTDAWHAMTREEQTSITERAEVIRYSPEQIMLYAKEREEVEQREPGE